uniref:ABC transporter permease n=1 Tax=Ndongobacter massiliensis TaxID=1871025 RepID=UPI00093059E7|nr:ABC transporter permease [Ndongobacter massiliensis]
MIRFIVKRILNLIPVLFIISILLFGISKMMPGDPVLLMMPQSGYKSAQERQEQYDRYKKMYGFDQPVPIQYANWLGRTLRGDFGESTKYRQPVTEVIKEPLRNSLILNLGATFLSFVLSIYIGIKSAVRPGGFFDRFFQVFSLAGISLPTFFIGITLIYFFALRLGWLPPGGMPRNNTFLEWLQYLLLPMLTLTIASLASTSRYVRTAMLDALSQDYIRTARAKGLSERKVIYQHAFRNALIPVVTVLAWSITSLLGGSAITEQVFAYKGIGQYLIASVTTQDFNLLMALNMMYAILSVAGNLLMDIGYSIADPRVRLE